MQSIVLEDAAQQFAAIEPLDEKNLDQRSISFGFSLQIIAREGLSVRGDAHMQKTTTGIPRRASLPADVTEDFDDQLPQAMPRSQIRWRPTNQATAGQDVLAPHGCTQDATVPQATTRRISGSTRGGLYVLLALCLAYLYVGIAVPAWENLNNQLHYGDARIASYDIDHRHFVTEDNKGKIRVYVISQDGQHVQVLDSILGSNTDHALVTLKDEGSDIAMSVNGVQTALLVPNGQGGFKWGGN